MTEQPPHDTVREAFEAFASSKGWSTYRCTEDALLAWQAATEQSALKADAVAKNYVLRGDYGRGVHAQIVNVVQSLAAAIRGG